MPPSDTVDRTPDGFKLQNSKSFDCEFQKKSELHLVLMEFQTAAHFQD